mmetsp:Transcript_47712/g.112266  ORF Transcript_47712/g.112266 Transcript_47712/m.112266 type:complete len:151 (-) Transcript_47712:73-525(-)
MYRMFQSVTLLSACVCYLFTFWRLRAVFREYRLWEFRFSSADKGIRRARYICVVCFLAVAVRGAAHVITGFDATLNSRLFGAGTYRNTLWYVCSEYIVVWFIVIMQCTSSAIGKTQNASTLELVSSPGPASFRSYANSVDLSQQEGVTPV